MNSNSVIWLLNCWQADWIYNTGHTNKWAGPLNDWSDQTDLMMLKRWSWQANAKCDTGRWRWHHLPSLVTAPTGGVYFCVTLLSLACGCHISPGVTTDMLGCTLQMDAVSQTTREATANMYTLQKKRVHCAKECGNQKDSWANRTIFSPE